MNNNLIGRIILVDWSKYQTAYGPANQKHCPNNPNWLTSVPDLLIQLLSSNEQTALDATHYLWASICHQGWPSDASIPATPFLLEILTFTSPKIQTEILCIINDWVLTLSEMQLTTSYGTNLIQLLKDNLSVFQKIKTTAEPNSDLAEFATTIVEVLNQSNED